MDVADNIYKEANALKKLLEAKSAAKELYQANQTEHGKEIIKSYLDDYLKNPPFPVPDITEINKFIFNFCCNYLSYESINHWDWLIEGWGHPFPFQYEKFIRQAIKNRISISGAVLSRIKRHKFSSWSIYDGYLIEFPEINREKINADINPGGLNHGMKTPSISYILLEKNIHEPSESPRSFIWSVTENFESIRQLSFDDDCLSSRMIGEVKRETLTGKLHEKNAKVFCSKIASMLPPPDKKYEKYFNEGDRLMALFSQRS